jgi:hypothetical protein
VSTVEHVHEGIVLAHVCSLSYCLASARGQLLVFVVLTCVVTCD